MHMEKYDVDTASTQYPNAYFPILKVTMFFIDIMKNYLAFIQINM